ncbi:MAG: hypothetical protein CMJ08_07020 [Pelagibacterales bacterium]|nr:hypothetical protein [Pelagibacterales bacterium]
MQKKKIKGLENFIKFIFCFYKEKNNNRKKIISELVYLSYPLYLMHIVIIYFVKNINFNNLIINAFIIIIINFLCAYLIRKYIKLPFLRIRPNYK